MMRIRLASAPSRTSGEPEPVRSLEARDSWKTWVAVKAPREKPSQPAERTLERPGPRWLGHPIPKPYQPPDES
jgi:hypothetical protein